MDSMYRNQEWDICLTLSIRCHLLPSGAHIENKMKTRHH